MLGWKGGEQWLQGHVGSITLELADVALARYRHTPKPPSPGIKSPFSGPVFALELTGIRRLVVQIKAIEKDDLLPLYLGARRCDAGTP